MSITAKSNLVREADACGTSYTKALDCSTTDERRTLFLNRSQAHFKAGHFDEAICDVERAPQGNTLADKAALRSAQALYSLERYWESYSVLHDFCWKSPTNTYAREQVERAARRLVEEEMGEYDFSKMSKEAVTLLPPHLDYATYSSPVTIGITGSKRRGLFTTRDVKAGDLLLCEKAFAHSFIDIDNIDRQKDDLLIHLNAETDCTIMPVESELLRLVVHKVCHNPALLPIITDLEDGCFPRVSTSTVDDEPVVDL